MAKIDKFEHYQYAVVAPCSGSNDCYSAYAIFDILPNFIPLVRKQAEILNLKVNKDIVTAVFQDITGVQLIISELLPTSEPNEDYRYLWSYTLAECNDEYGEPVYIGDIDIESEHIVDLKSCYMNVTRGSPGNLRVSFELYCSYGVFQTAEWAIDELEDLIPPSVKLVSEHRRRLKPRKVKSKKRSK